MRNILIILVFAIGLISCEKDDYLINDDNYPTTIREISSDEISQLRSEYYLENKYIVTSLNNFGFCHFRDNNPEIESPPITGSLTQQEATDIVENFVLLNKAHTGINSFDNVEFDDINSRALSPDGSFMWTFETKNQYIDTLEVLKTKIIFMIKNSEMYWCVGNWYPEIYIPSEFNFSSNKAKSLLVDKVVSHLGWTGEYEVTITQESLDKSDVRLVVNPIKTETEIEVRIAWEINIPGPVHYLIYVDVMTGKIIEKEPTIIA